MDGVFHLVHAHHLGREAVAEQHKIVHLDALGGPVCEEREQSEGVRGRKREARVYVLVCVCVWENGNVRTRKR